MRAREGTEGQKYKRHGGFWETSATSAIVPLLGIVTVGQRMHRQWTWLVHRPELSMVFYGVTEVTDVTSFFQKSPCARERGYRRAKVQNAMGTFGKQVPLQSLRHYLGISSAI